MPESPVETARKPASAAEWLAVISGQLAELQATANRIENEFVPPLRSLLGKRLAKVAARSGGLWDRNQGGFDK